MMRRSRCEAHSVKIDQQRVQREILGRAGASLPMHSPKAGPALTRAATSIVRNTASSAVQHGWASLSFSPGLPQLDGLP